MINLLLTCKVTLASINVLLCLTGFGILCGGSKNVVEQEFLPQINSSVFTPQVTDSSVYFIDTITVTTADELLEGIRSNRLIKLTDTQYEFENTLQIKGIKNLKIIGTSCSELMVVGRNKTVINIANSYNVYLSGLIIGHTESPVFKGDIGTFRISNCNNISVDNCRVLGAGTFGVYTFEVNNLRVLNTEITACTGLLFELEKTRDVLFENTIFKDNNLAISVMGGFTNLTKDVTFLNCQFINNTPATAGNPAFNFADNYDDFDEKIVFKNCIFRNNKGYKWYGEKIKLDNCKIDSTDFTGW